MRVFAVLQAVICHLAGRLARVDESEKANI